MNNPYKIMIFNKVIFSIILTICIGTKVRAQTDKPLSIRVLPIDTMGVYSDIFTPVDFLYYNEHYSIDLIQNLNYCFEQSLKNSFSKEMTFDYVEDTVLYNLAGRVQKAEIKAEKDTFVGFKFDNNGQWILSEYLHNSKADYLLTLNLYEIAQIGSIKNQDTQYDLRAKHKIHFDLFDSQMNLIHSGIFEKQLATLKYNQIKKQFVSEFKLEVESIVLSKEQQLSSNSDEYKAIKESIRFKSNDKGGIWAMAGSTGLGGVYGFIGLEAIYMPKPSIEIGTGIGYDVSGFKYGFNGRFHFGTAKVRPNVLLGYSWSGGTTGKISEETDQNGNIIGGLEYRIFADQALHLGAGLTFDVNSDFFVVTNAGYAFPTIGKKPEIIGFPTEKERDKVEGWALGGFQFSIHVVYMFKKY